MIKAVEVPHNPEAIALLCGEKMAELSVLALALGGHLGQSADEARASLLDAVGEVFDNTVLLVQKPGAMVSNDA